MRKKLSFITNEHGYFLPFVLFFTTIILLIIIGSINNYHNELTMSHRLHEQIKIETLYQMGLAQFKKDIALIGESDTILWAREFAYQFPYGHVDITFERKGDYLYIAYFIMTDKAVSSSTITNIIPVSELLSLEMSQTNE